MKKIILLLLICLMTLQSACATGSSAVDEVSVENIVAEANKLTVEFGQATLVNYSHEDIVRLLPVFEGAKEEKTSQYSVMTNDEAMVNFSDGYISYIDSFNLVSAIQYFIGSNGDLYNRVTNEKLTNLPKENLSFMTREEAEKVALDFIAGLGISNEFVAEVFTIEHSTLAAEQSKITTEIEELENEIEKLNSENKFGSAKEKMLDLEALENRRLENLGEAHDTYYIELTTKYNDDNISVNPVGETAFHFTGRANHSMVCLVTADGLVYFSGSVLYTDMITENKEVIDEEAVKKIFTEYTSQYLSAMYEKSIVSCDFMYYYHVYEDTDNLEIRPVWVVYYSTEDYSHTQYDESKEIHAVTYDAVNGSKLY